MEKFWNCVIYSRLSIIQISITAGPIKNLRIIQPQKPIANFKPKTLPSLTKHLPMLVTVSIGHQLLGGLESYLCVNIWRNSDIRFQLGSLQIFLSLHL